MNCQDARNRLTKRLYEPLDSHESAELERHLQGCRACAAEAESAPRFEAELRRLHAAAPRRAVVAAPVDLDRVFGRSRGSLGLTPPRRLGYAAAVALAALAAAALSLRLMPDSGRSVQPVEVAKGGRLPHRDLPPQPPSLKGRGSATAADVASASTVKPTSGMSDAHQPSAGERGSPEAPTLPAKRTLPVQPDARFLDGRAPALLAEFLGGSRAAARKWVESPLPPLRDDFISIAPPPVAAAQGGAGAAARTVEKEAGVVDPRLFQKVTLRLKGGSMEELCAELERQTRVRIRSSRGMQDEKATVLVKERPAREVMRAVSRLFGCTWARSGSEGEYRYELVQDLREQLAEQEARNADLNAALLALDEKMGAYRALLDMTPEQIRERLRQAKGPERDLLAKVNGPQWGGMQAYHRLTPVERASLAAGQSLHFSSDSSRAENRLPDEWRKPLLRSWGDQAMAWSSELKNMVISSYASLRQQGLNPTRIEDWPGASVQVGLRIDRSELGQLSLQAESSYMTPYKRPEPPYTESTPGLGGEDTLTTATSPSVLNPDNAAANRALRGRAPFTQEIALKPEPSCPVCRAEAAKKRGTGSDPSRPLYPVGRPISSLSILRVEREARLRGPHVTTADVWEAVHDQTGLPIVADFYTRVYPAGKVTVQKATLFEALCRACDELRVRWRKDGDFLMGRSTSFFWDKLKEVPKRDLERWQKDREVQGGLPFAALLEMASLRDEQLDSKITADAIVHCWGLSDWDLLQRQIGYDASRPWLRFLAAMPEARRREVLSPEGVLVGSLTPGEQQEVMRLMGGRLVGGPLEALRGVSTWRLQVGYAPAGWYCWVPVVRQDRPKDKTDALPLCAARTAKEAFAAAGRIDPAVVPEEIEKSEGVLLVTLVTPTIGPWHITGERPVQFSFPVPPR